MIMFKDVGVDPLPNHRREPAALVSMHLPPIGRSLPYAPGT